MSVLTPTDKECTPEAWESDFQPMNLATFPVQVSPSCVIHATKIGVKKQEMEFTRQTVLSYDGISIRPLLYLFLKDSPYHCFSTGEVLCLGSVLKVGDKKEEPLDARFVVVALEGWKVEPDTILASPAWMQNVAQNAQMEFNKRWSASVQKVDPTVDKIQVMNDDSLLRASVQLGIQLLKERALDGLADTETDDRRDDRSQSSFQKEEKRHGFKFQTTIESHESRPKPMDVELVVAHARDQVEAEKEGGRKEGLAPNSDTEVTVPAHESHLPLDSNPIIDPSRTTTMTGGYDAGFDTKDEMETVDAGGGAKEGGNEEEESAHEEESATPGEQIPTQ